MNAHQLAHDLNWRFAPRELTPSEKVECLTEGLPGGRYDQHPRRKRDLERRRRLLRELSRPHAGRLEGPLRPGSAWDVAPSTDYVSQAYGCTSFNLEWPCAGCGARYFHAGIDLGYSGDGWAIYRTPVVATRPGLVVAVGMPYLGDQAVSVRYDDGIFLEHGHLDEAWAGVGARVQPGDVIGLLGTKGASTAPHIHVEARVDGPFQGVAGCPSNDPSRDPSAYLNGLASSCPGFQGVTADGGVHVRVLPGQDQQIVQQPGDNPDVVDGGMTLCFDAWCHHAVSGRVTQWGSDTAIPADAWTGAPDDRWFRTASGRWIASAGINGSPPAGMAAIADPAPGAPLPVPTWAATAAPGGPHVRAYPGQDAPVVRDCAPNEPLTLDAWCHYGSGIPDAWTGQPDDRWVRLLDHSGWLANAVVNGNPPGSVQPVDAAAFRPPPPAPPPPPPPVGPVATTLPDALRSVAVEETSPTYGPAADYAALARVGVKVVYIRAANGDGTGSKDRDFEANWTTRAPRAREGGVSPFPWTYWYGVSEGVTGDVAAYLQRCADYTAARHAAMDPKPLAWKVDAEDKTLAGLGRALASLSAQTQVPVILTGYGDPVTAGVRWADWAEIAAAIAAYAPQLYTLDWGSAMSIDHALGELQQMGLAAPLLPVLDEVAAAGIHDIVTRVKAASAAGISWWYWSGAPGDPNAVKAYLAEWTGIEPPPLPQPPPPPPGILAWLQAMLDWLRRIFPESSS
jgi:murein DD-endopeptidase MepM/ murein hydrolase activator NlpD